MAHNRCIEKIFDYIGNGLWWNLLYWFWLVNLEWSRSYVLLQIIDSLKKVPLRDLLCRLLYIWEVTLPVEDTLLKAIQRELIASISRLLTHSYSDSTRSTIVVIVITIATNTHAHSINRKPNHRTPYDSKDTSSFDTAAHPISHTWWRNVP